VGLVTVVTGVLALIISDLTIIGIPLHSGGNLGVRLGLELDKNIFKSIQKYFKSIQKYLTHTNSGLAHPKLFGSKYFWYVKYFYSYMSLFGQKLKFCFLCPMKTNVGKK